MVKLSSTLFGIVFLVLATRALAQWRPVDLKLIKAVFRDNTVGNPIFSPSILIETMKMFSNTTIGNTAAEINDVMLLKRARTSIDTDEMIYIDTSLENNTATIEELSDNENNTATIEELSDNENNTATIEELSDNEPPSVDARSVAEVLSIKNIMFIDQSVKPNGVTLTEQIDFKNVKKAKNIINKWVARNTKKKITDLIENLNENTKIITVAASYFESLWKYKFNSQTKNVPFYTGPGASVSVEMMGLNGRFLHKYIKKLKANLLVLPFINQKFKMLILLPKKVNGLKFLLKKLTTIKLKDLFVKHPPKQVFVQLPKFDMDFKIDLKAPLENLGIKDLFNNAKFAHLNSNHGVMKVDSILHRIFLRVNQNGALAATAARAGKITQFKVDHPFIFLIRHKKNILYAGRFNAPN